MDQTEVATSALADDNNGQAVATSPENKTKNGNGGSGPRYKVLDSNAIKLIAIIAMTIDHIAWAVAPGYSTEWWAIVMHVIGRLTKPIMWYCIAEGYHYTRNVKKYTARLFLFALISHVPYMMQTIQFKQYGWLSLVPFATGEGFMGHVLNQTSVMLSLAVGLVMLRVNDSTGLPQWAKVLIVLGLCVVAFPADGSCIGSLCVQYRQQQGQTRKAIFVVPAVCYDVRGGVLLLSGQAVRRHSDVRSVGAAGAYDVQRQTRQQSQSKQSVEVELLRLLSASSVCDFRRVAAVRRGGCVSSAKLKRL